MWNLVNSYKSPNFPLLPKCLLSQKDSVEVQEQDGWCWSYLLPCKRRVMTPQLFVIRLLCRPHPSPTKSGLAGQILSSLIDAWHFCCQAIQFLLVPFQELKSRCPIATGITSGDICCCQLWSTVDAAILELLRFLHLTFLWSYQQSLLFAWRQFEGSWVARTPSLR